MRYQISGKNITVTEGISSQITRKLSKMDKYFHADDDVRFHASVAVHHDSPRRVYGLFRTESAGVPVSPRSVRRDCSERFGPCAVLVCVRHPGLRGNQSDGLGILFAQGDENSGPRFDSLHCAECDPEPLADGADEAGRNRSGHNGDRLSEQSDSARSPAEGAGKNAAEKHGASVLPDRRDFRSRRIRRLWGLSGMLCSVRIRSAAETVSAMVLRKLCVRRGVCGSGVPAGNPGGETGPEDNPPEIFPLRGAERLHSASDEGILPGYTQSKERFPCTPFLPCCRFLPRCF